MKRKFSLCKILFLAVFLFCFAFPAFAAPDRPLVVVSAWEASGMDPVTSGFIFTRMGCLETLLTSDRKGGMEPRLATGWDVSENGCTWTFHLRKGVVFHDGTPLTGNVAAASLNRTLAKGGLFKGTPVTAFSGNGMDLVVTTETPFSALPAYLLHYSAALSAPSAFDEKGNAVNVVGTGFYRMTSYQEGRIVDFEAFEDYWGEKAAIAKARYFAVPNPETRVLLAESGEGDIVVDISSEAADRLRANPNLSVTSQPLPRVRLLALNSALPFFSNAELRKALSLLMDRESIATALLKNPKAAATQLFPEVASWHNENLAPLEYDPSKARAILRQEGWIPNDKGILTKDGQPLAFEILTYASRPDLPLIAEVLQQSLRNEGILVTVRVEKSGMIAECQKDGSLQSAFMARNFGSVADPIGTVITDFGPEKGRGGWGAMNWSSHSFDEAVKRYLNTFDAEGQEELRQKMTDILQRELPIVPIAWYDNHVAVSEKVRGIQLDPSEMRPYPEGVAWTE